MQGNQPPQQPWGFPPDQPGQWGQPPSQGYSSPYNQPTQGWQPAQSWQQPIPPPPLQRGGKPPKKPPKKRLTKRDKIIGVGCLGVFLLLLCGVCAAINNVNANNSPAAAVPTTIVAVPSDTPTTIVQAAQSTDTPTTASIPTPTPTAKPRPTPTPTQIVQQPTPTPTQGHTGVNGNPWGYDFNPGNLIYSPNSGFCGYFQCVSTFWTDTNGYVAECGNGSYTHSGGVRGACSRDGGVSRTLYSH